MHHVEAVLNTYDNRFYTLDAMCAVHQVRFLFLYDAVDVRRAVRKASRAVEHAVAPRAGLLASRRDQPHLHVR